MKRATWVAIMRRLPLFTPVPVVRWIGRRRDAAGRRENRERENAALGRVLLREHEAAKARRP